MVKLSQGKIVEIGWVGGGGVEGVAGPTIESTENETNANKDKSPLIHSAIKGLSFSIVKGI